MSPWPWLLVATRFWALLRVQVVLREAVGSPALWEAGAAVFATVLAFAVVEPAQPEVLTSALLVGFLFEFALGSVLGQWASLSGYALLGAAGVSSQLLVPGAGGQGGRGLAMLLVVLAAGCALALGLHRPLLAALWWSVELWPPGRPEQWALTVADGLAELVLAARALVVLALALATPVLLCAALTDVVTRVVGRGPRSVPGLVEALRPWASTALALAALAASWDAYPELWASALGRP